MRKVLFLAVGVAIAACANAGQEGLTCGPSRIELKQDRFSGYFEAMTPPTPDSPAVGLIWSSQNANYLYFIFNLPNASVVPKYSDCTAWILSDGSRVPVRRVVYRGLDKERRHEALSAVIDWSDFYLLSGASLVEFRICDTEFKASLATTCDIRGLLDAVSKWKKL
jgi:hypothetical protein